MTLKDQFYQYCNNSNVREDYAEQCEKIAQEFAIEFAEWIVKNCNHSKLKTLDYKELLEIYKKEKQL
jgi:hypothetical protein